MNWYLAKIVFRIVCGEGRHAAQFDEQLRLISADNEDEAFDKAVELGMREQERFYNARQQIVSWNFVNVSELYRLSQLIDGAELYSRIKEVDDADTYIGLVNRKSESLKEMKTHQILNLI